MIFYSLLPIFQKTFLKQKNFFPVQSNSTRQKLSRVFSFFFSLLRLTKVEFSKTKQDKRKTKIIINGYKLYARCVQFEKNITFFNSYSVAPNKHLAK